MSQIALARAESWATDAAFASKVPTLTRPSGVGVHDVPGASFGGGGGVVVVLPIGKGAENDAFNMHLILWSPVEMDLATIWIPFRAFASPMVCTMGSQTGVDGSVIPSTVRMVDTITNADTDITSQSHGTAIVSPADNGQGWFAAPIMGADIIEFIFAHQTNTPDMNAIWYFW